MKPKGVTVSAMLAKAVAEVLKKHPIVNAAYVEGGIKYNKGEEHLSLIAFEGQYRSELKALASLLLYTEVCQ